jgi:hypothetical protein
MTHRTLAQTQPPVLTTSPLSKGSILQRNCESCGNHRIAGGECADCGKKKNVLQRKLAIGASNDPLEQEADRVADQVRAASEHLGVSSAPPRIQRFTGQMTEGVGTAPASVERVLSSPGRPLDPAIQKDMGQRFNHDFSRVRVHTDTEAGRSARDISANAYTMGQNIVFGTGQFAPETHKGRSLIAHELTHVMQQRTVNSLSLIQRDLVYGDAYPRSYKDDSAETLSAEADTWYPASIDFKATATNSGGGDAIKSFDALLTWIGKKSAGSITELGLIGHANSSNFGLSGTITTNPKDVTFTADGLINSGTLSTKMSKIMSVRDRFAANAKIILYGCHAGTGKSLLEDISNAFGVCVKGFTDEILWCITWSTPSRTINSRGRIFVEKANNPDPLAGLIKTPCTSFYTSLSSLTPDGESCKGVAKPKKNSSEPMIEAGDLQEGNLSSEDVTREV